MTKLTHALYKPWLKWLTFALVLIVELFTATIGDLLVLPFDDKTLPYKVFCYTTYGRIVIWSICSVLVAQRRFWRYYTNIDALLVSAIGSAVSFVSMLIEDPGVADEALVTQASIVYCALLFFLVGNFRAMIRWFPWTKPKIVLYKLVRFYHCVFFIVQQVVARKVQLSSAIAYFAATVGLLIGMMSIVVIKEKEVTRVENEQKKQKSETPLA